MWGAQVSRYDLLSHDRAASMPGAPLFNNNAIYQGAAMFRDAVSTASKFTFPVVLSRQDVAGNCSSGVGSFVVVNNEGWIVTAAHIITQLEAANNEAAKVALHLTNEANIRADITLGPKERQKALAKLGKLDPILTKNSGAWWGLPNADVIITNIHLIASVDIAVGRLEPFDPSWVTEYPKFKDPTKDLRPGMTLCKLGFPFHSFQPSWNDVDKRFEFPAGTMPLTSFPIDGIFSKTYDVQDPINHGFALKWLVTSTPGLQGQSGGPTFDANGTVCAIQSKTAHLSLGFDIDVPGKPGQKEYQFLNVGLGVHPTTIYGLFNSLGLRFDAAPD